MKLRSDDWSLDLDSFLDIVTNAIGFLMLVALLAAISSQNMSVLLATPVLRPPPPGTTRVLFECRGNRILRIDQDTIHRNIREAVRRHPRAPGAKPGITEIPAVFQQADIGDAFYRVRAEMEREGTAAKEAELVLIYERRSAEHGEVIESLRQPSSTYRALIRSLDANKHFAYFIVRQDSFEVFREARTIAREHGLAIGWAPQPLAEELRFSETGAFGRDVQN